VNTRFVVTFKSAPGVNGIRALLWLLKRAYRQYGLLAVDARVERAPDAREQIAGALVQLHSGVNNRLREHS
jgi:hypothetical protein